MSTNTDNKDTAPAISTRGEFGLKLLSSIGATGIFMIAILYIIGYLIWNSYLGHYGIHIQDFLRLEFLSAAFCYLLFFSVLTIPTTYLFYYYMYQRSHEEKKSFDWGILLIWTLLLIQFHTFFDFSSPRQNVLSTPSVIIILSIGFLHILFAAFRKMLPDWKVKNILLQVEWLWAYMWTLVIVSFYYTDTIDSRFLSSSLFTFIAALSSYIIQPAFRKSFKNHRVFGSLLLCVVSFLIILNNAKLFWERQFSLIPVEKGGAKPQKVLIYPSVIGGDVLKSLSIKSDSNGWYGPIFVVAKSEKDLYFVETIDTNMLASRQSKSIRLSLIQSLDYRLETK
jgi:hypothetical protein